MFETHLLSLAIWVPIFAGILVLFTGNDKNSALARWLALAGSLAAFVITIPLYTHFDFANGGFQFSETYEWITSFNIHYSLGVDGIAVPLILLTSFTTVLVVIAGWEVIETRVAQSFAFESRSDRPYEHAAITRGCA